MRKIVKLVVLILSAYYGTGCQEEDSAQKTYENYDLFGKYSIVSTIYYGIEINFQGYFWGQLTDEQKSFLLSKIGPITLEDGHVDYDRLVSEAVAWPTKFYILSDKWLHRSTCSPASTPLPYCYDKARKILYVGWDDDQIVDVDDPQMKMEKEGDMFIFKEYHKFLDSSGEWVCYNDPYRITKYSKSKTFPLEKYM